MLVAWTLGYQGGGEESEKEEAFRSEGLPVWKQLYLHPAIHALQGM